MNIPIPSRKFALTALTILASVSLGHAQSTWDGGGNPSLNWSTFTNWNTDASPANTTVTFANTGSTSNSTTVGNIVDQNFTITSLAYTGSSVSAGPWQVTQIVASTTLTVDAGVATGNSFLVGGYTVGTVTTAAAFTGAGALVVNGASSAFTVSNVGGNNVGRAILDLSALGSFQATVSSFTVGGNGGGISIPDAYGTLYLSDASSITADTLTTGSGNNDYNNRSNISNRLYLGNNTVMNVNTINFASGRTVGLVQFRPSGSGANTTAATNGVLTIRGKTGGSSRAVLTIGDLGGSNSANQNGSSLVDLTAGSVDALVSTLTVGRSAAALTGNYNATLSMAAGTLDATNTLVGEIAGTNVSSGTVLANLNVGGGTLSTGTLTLGSNTTVGTRSTTATLNVSGSGHVNIASDLVMGRRNGSTNITSIVNITNAGSLLVGGNLTEGTGAGANIVSTVNLSSGTLNMDHGNIAVDSFNLTGGTLKDVASFSAGTTGGLNVQNSATLAFGLDNSFISMTLTGTMGLGGSSNLGLVLADGYNPGSSFTLVSNDGGDFITGTFATINGLSFGPGNAFSLTNNLGTFQYELSYLGGDGNDLVALAVPEPSTCLLVGAGFVSLLWRRRVKAGRPA